MNLVVRPLYANVYLLSTPQGRVLVDSGALSHAPVFARLLGQFQPDVVVLTHAHVDHAGNAFLAARAGVSVLAHPLEHPALLGQSHDLPYPAGFPALGRVISRAHPKLRSVQAAGPGETVLGWQVVHLPGHTLGQIGLLRDGVLIAGDAVVGGAGGAHLPRAAYNHDHAQALSTLKAMVDLDLREIWPGHGGRLTPGQIRMRAERVDG
ncbi:MBL fold metallo-hydrolase [Deinococcus radiotolerans]|uniref:MBL fold metallo-hydrolase n=1 Tax=Deinococcus radiotolerans TaxID=1309407 RepID=UPI001E2C89D1|nr:MBL fold metallo-hydrolase [Deinococcus radiotolerans]